jgi:predicted metal-dependent phosphotriesterase family hydrolase
MIARADAILGTGHLAPQETLALAALARNAGVSKILVTHPEFDAIAMDLATQAALADQGAFFERCYHTLHGAAPGRTKAMADAIRYLGPESTVLASDAGQLGGASPAHALLRFCEELLRYGIAADQIAMMLKDNPAWLLGLAR